MNEGVLKPVGKEYIFSELVNPVYNRNGNQVTASLAVKYLDNQTMTTQVSQFDLVLEKNGENWENCEIVIEKRAFLIWRFARFSYKVYKEIFV